jgi:hypothetical protein
LAFRLFWQRKLLNFILVAQLLFSVITLTPIVVRVIHHAEILRTINEFRPEQVYHFQPFTNLSGAAGNVMAELEESNDVLIGRIYNVFALEKCLAYNEVFTQMYKPSLGAGTWFFDLTWQDETAMPAVVSADSGRSLGEKFTLTLLKGDGTPQPVSAQVAGILRKPTQYLDGWGWADPAYIKVDVIISTEDVVLLRAEDVYRTMPGSLSAQETKLISYPASADESTLNRLRNYGFQTPFSQLISQFRDDELMSIRYEAVTFLTFMLLAVVGIGGNNFAQNIENRRKFTIYYLLGMTRRQRVGIELMRLSILLLFSMIGVFLIGMLQQELFEERKLWFMLSALLYLVVVFTITSVGFLRSSSKLNVVDAIREFRS